MKQLCINVDWFEIFTHEPLSITGPEFFEALGFKVAVREYGTRIYKQMFTLIENGEPWIEIRRMPLSDKRQGGIMHPRACSIRLVNKQCYAANALKDLYDFLGALGYKHNNYEIACISRIDICLDFVKFNYKQDKDPSQFIKNYLSGIYGKINQPRLNVHGKDFLSDKIYNSIKWGSPASMISTKLYNKTVEMAENKEKPYIRDSWVQCGLLADEFDDTAVWRLEFSINSDCRQWVTEGKGNERIIIDNTFEFFLKRENLLRTLRGLISHYFKFVKLEPGKSRYKLEPIKLIELGTGEAYKPKALDRKEPQGRTEKLLIKRLARLKTLSDADSPTAFALSVAIDLITAKYARIKLGLQPNDSEDLQRLTNKLSLSTIYDTLQGAAADTSTPPQQRQAAAILLQALTANEQLVWRYLADAENTRSVERACNFQRQREQDRKKQLYEEEKYIKFLIAEELKIKPF